MKKIKWLLFALLLLPLGVFLGACGEKEQPLEISVADDFIVEGNSISTKVSNATDSILLYEKISVSKDVSWKLYTDIEGQNEIVTKSVSLEVGDNKFYIIVSDKDENIKLYNVNIRRRPMYNVSFSTNGGGDVDTQVIEEDNVATIPEVVPIKEGHTFVSWNFDFSQGITEDKIIVANYTSNRYIATYKLNNGCDDIQQEVSYAEMAQLKSAENTLRDGYKFEYWTYTYESENYQVTGQSMFKWDFPCDITFNAIWSLRTYLINYELNGGQFINEEDVITTYTIESDTYNIPKPYKSGLSFGGWYNNASFSGESIETISAGSFGNVSLYAKWYVVDAAYQDYRDLNEEVVALCERADNGETISNFNAVEIFEIAEYKLLHSDKYYSVICGTNSSVFSQYQSKEILWRDGKIIINKLSPGSIILGVDTNVHAQTIYLPKDDIITVNKDGVFLNQKTYGNAADMTDAEIVPMDGIFNSSNIITYTLENYFNMYGRTPLNSIPYIISSITCAQGNYTAPTINTDGTYTFEINLSDDYLYAAALYYSKEIKQDLGDEPIWHSVNIRVTVDLNFCFKKIVYTENYNVLRQGISVSFSGDLVQKFEYDDLPTIDGLQHLDDYVRYSDIDKDDFCVYDASEYDEAEGYVDASSKLAYYSNPGEVIIYAVGCEKDIKGFTLYRTIMSGSTTLASIKTYNNKNLVFNYGSYTSLQTNNYPIRKATSAVTSDEEMLDYLKDNGYMIVVDNANYKHIYETFESIIGSGKSDAEALEYFKGDDAKTTGFAYIDMDSTLGSKESSSTTTNGSGTGLYYISYILKKNYDNKEFVRIFNYFILTFIDDETPYIRVKSESYSCDNNVVSFEVIVSDNRDSRLHLEAMYRLLTGTKEVIIVDGLQSSYVLGIKGDLNESQLSDYNEFFEVPNESEMSGYVKLLAENGAYVLNLDEFVESAKYLQIVLYAYDDSGNVGVVAKEIEISYYLNLLYTTPIMEIDGISSCTEQIGAEIYLPTPKVKFEYKDSVCYSEMEKSINQNIILGLEKNDNGEYISTDYSTTYGNAGSFIPTKIGRYELTYSARIRVYNRTKFEYHETYFTRIGYDDISIDFINSNEIKLSRNSEVYSVYLEDGNVSIENGIDAVFGITNEEFTQWFDDFDYFTLTSDIYIITILDGIGPKIVDYYYDTAMSVDDFHVNGFIIFSIEATDANGIDVEKSSITISWKRANGTISGSRGSKTYIGSSAFCDIVYTAIETGTDKLDGAYTITYKVYDNVGNFTTKVYTIYVGDNHAPTISFDHDFIDTNYTIGSNLRVDITKIIVTDNVSTFINYIPTITLTNESTASEIASVKEGNYITFDEFEEVGTYTLKIEAKDDVGNVSIETFSIEVSRNII